MLNKRHIIKEDTLTKEGTFVREASPRCGNSSTIATYYTWKVKRKGQIQWAMGFPTCDLCVLLEIAEPSPVE